MMALQMRDEHKCVTSSLGKGRSQVSSTVTPGQGADATFLEARLRDGASVPGQLSSRAPAESAIEPRGDFLPPTDSSAPLGRPPVP